MPPLGKLKLRLKLGSKVAPPPEPRRSSEAETKPSPSSDSMKHQLLRQPCTSTRSPERSVSMTRNDVPGPDRTLAVVVTVAGAAIETVGRKTTAAAQKTAAAVAARSRFRLVWIRMRRSWILLLS